MLFDSKIKYGFANTENETLLIITPEQNLNIFEWVKEHKNLLESYIIKFGGILLRGFGLHAVSEFNKVVQIFCPNLLEYTYRSTPRTKLGGKIYTATEYPANKIIPLHNENSYSHSWPQKIFFFSVIVAEYGGETPIADSRKVYNNIDQNIRTKFEKDGILYVRNYTAGIDLSWQEVFQTDQKEAVEQYCYDNNIEFSWNNTGPELTTKQICQASFEHTKSKEQVWFNQAHLFHLSALDENDRMALIDQVGIDNVPRNVFYGNGAPIEVKALSHIRQVYNQEKIKFKWQKGDIMVLDNVLTAHGREPFKGERKVAVAMG